MDRENRVYVADTGNNRVQVFSSSGELLSMRYSWSMDVSGAYAHPLLIAVGGPENNVYLVEKRDETLIHWKMLVFSAEVP